MQGSGPNWLPGHREFSRFSRWPVRPCVHECRRLRHALYKISFLSSVCTIFLQRLCLIKMYLYSFNLKLLLSHNPLTQALVSAGVCCCCRLRCSILCLFCLFSLIFYCETTGQCCHLAEQLISASQCAYASCVYIHVVCEVTKIGWCAYRVRILF